MPQPDNFSSRCACYGGGGGSCLKVARWADLPFMAMEGDLPLIVWRTARRPPPPVSCAESKFNEVPPACSALCSLSTLTCPPPSNATGGCRRMAAIGRCHRCCRPCRPAHRRAGRPHPPYCRPAPAQVCQMHCSDPGAFIAAWQAAHYSHHIHRTDLSRLPPAVDGGCLRRPRAHSSSTHRAAQHPALKSSQHPAGSARRPHAPSRCRRQGRLPRGS